MEHNKSQNVSSVVRENGGCPQETLPNPSRYPAGYEVGHRASQVTNPVPDAPRRVSAVNIKNIRVTVLALSPDRVVIRKEAVISKVTPLIKQYCGSVAGEHV